MEAVRRVFSNPNALLVGVLLTFIPYLVYFLLIVTLAPEAVARVLVDEDTSRVGLKVALIMIAYGLLQVIAGLAIIGYLLRCARTEGRAPDWRGVGKLLWDGFRAGVISLIYYLPLIIMFFAFLAMLGLLVLSSLGAEDWASMIGSGTPITGTSIVAESAGGWLGFVLGLGLLLLLMLPLALFIIVWVPMAVVHFGFMDRFAAGFDFREIRRKVFTGNYVMSLLAILAIGIVAVLVVLLPLILLELLALIPVIGPVFKLVGEFIAAIVSVAMGIVAYTIIGEVYRELSGKPSHAEAEPESAQPPETSAGVKASLKKRSVRKKGKSPSSSRSRTFRS